MSPGLELGVSFLLGILGAFLTVAAQRVAVSLGGFFIGGALAYWSGAWLTLPLDWQPGAWLWVVAIFGAIFGSMFAAVLFEASLLALTSLFGALLIAKASHVGAPHEGWLFLLLMGIGVIAQTGQQPATARPGTPVSSGLSTVEPVKLDSNGYSGEPDAGFLRPTQQALRHRRRRLGALLAPAGGRGTG